MVNPINKLPNDCDYKNVSLGKHLLALYPHEPSDFD